MSYDSGIWWPWGTPPSSFGAGSGTTLDASGEYAAFIGRIAIAGKATSKTLDTTGSSSIRFLLATAPVFDSISPTSEFTVGFRGIDKTTGLPVRPDASWATANYARSVITQAANTTPTLTTTSTTTGHVAIPTHGTITLSHGDEVCFVMEMTTRSGSDSVVTAGIARTSVGSQYPCGVTNVSGSVAVIGTMPGSVVITFSDGTIGVIDGTFQGVPLTQTFSDATNPDEYGQIFQVPFACKIDAIGFMMRLVDATSDLRFDLVSDPLGTPTSLVSGPITFNAENMSAASDLPVIYSLSSEISLAANTDYCVAVKATGAGTIRWNQASLMDAAVRSFMGPGVNTTTKGVTRNGGTGAYGSASTTVHNPFGVRISEITASGGGVSGNTSGGVQC